MSHPFPPVFDGHSHTLILGSYPSVRSRAEGFYYGHPQNRFWPMLAAIFGEEPPASAHKKKALLLRHGLAMWDVIASCEIIGSSDASIRNAEPVDIRAITEHAPIRRIICNGATAGKLYTRHLQPITGIPAIVLPSTSPANAAWRMERLVDVWGATLRLADQP